MWVSIRLRLLGAARPVAMCSGLVGVLRPAASLVVWHSRSGFGLPRCLASGKCDIGWSACGVCWLAVGAGPIAPTDFRGVTPGVIPQGAPCLRMTFSRPAAPQRQLPFPFRRQFDWAASAEADVAFGYAGSRRSPIPLACLPRISESTALWNGGAPIPHSCQPNCHFFALAAVREFRQLLDRGARLWDLRCLGCPDLSRLEFVK